MSTLVIHVGVILFITKKKGPPWNYSTMYIQIFLNMKNSTKLTTLHFSANGYIRNNMLSLPLQSVHHPCTQ